MNIGNIILDHDTGIDKGEILTLEKHVRFEMTSNPNYSASEDSPAFVIHAKGVHGELVEVGAAWKKVSLKGLPYLTLSLDAPEWSTRLNASAFQDKKDHLKMNIVFSRPTGRKVETAQTADAL